MGCRVHGDWGDTMKETFGQKVGNFFALLFALIVGGGMLFVLLYLRGWLAPFGLGGGSTRLVDDNTRPEREIVEPEPVAPAPVAESWSCFWDPTMNENWHDDVLCTRGYEAIRPELLAEQSFVTQDDMMRAAADYEMTLNQ